MQKSVTEKLNFLKEITAIRFQKSAHEVAIWCPFCNNPNKHKLKLAINLDKDLYHCFVCNKKGNNVPFVIKMLNSSYYDRSLEFFTSKSGNSQNNEWTDILKGLNDNVLDIEEVEKADFPDSFELCALNLKARDPDVRDVLLYMKNRGCNKHKMWMLRLGVSKHDQFKRMLIIPSFDVNGNLNYYTCRRIDSTTFNGQKYKNCTVPKKKIVFNELLINWKLPLTLVEGPLDLLKTNDNATCLLGSTLAKDSLLFRRIVENKTPIVLALDHDAYDKTLKIANDLLEYDIEVKIMDTSASKDVGDMDLETFKKYYDLACKVEKNDLLLNKIKLI